ncbi:MAG: ABC transporter ATP-binding protein [Candidatus Methanomethylophilaceae archaeon]|nr:ABC transporter ATP-binding protein [Candidatus Methanomethylophilaceae archaeon]
MDLFNLKDVTFTHASASAPAMAGFSLDIEEGVRTAILGANGAGKTTLFHTLTGVNKPQKGEVLYRGEPVQYTKEGLKALRSEVAVVLQNPDEQIFCSLVEEDVAFGPLNLGLDRDVVEERVEKVLRDVRLYGLNRRPLQQLSGGQRKRVAIAGALAMRPKVMIMDEPTAGLDPQASMEVMELAEKLALEGVTVLISTHDVDLAYGWADVADVIRHGNVEYSGVPEGFYSDAVKVYECGLLAPGVFTMNREASSRRGIPEEPYPRRQCEFLAKFGSCKKAGRLLLAPATPEEAEARLDSAAGDLKGAAVGIYGSDVRHALGGREADYMFDALDSCFGKAAEGGDAVLMYDPVYQPLMEAQRKRMSMFGLDLEVLRWPSPYWKPRTSRIPTAGRAPRSSTR